MAHLRQRNYERRALAALVVAVIATPPDVRVTMGGANAGFTSLMADLSYLQSHPNETVWVMSWDAPSLPGTPKSMKTPY